MKSSRLSLGIKQTGITVAERKDAGEDETCWKVGKRGYKSVLYCPMVVKWSVSAGGALRNVCIVPGGLCALARTAEVNPAKA